MNQDVGLRTLSQIMDWSDDHAREEFAWLKLMARLKYDGYRDFQAGMRFIESLATWLQQFNQDERETAYAFVRSSLVYIGPNEMQRLVEQFYPRIVGDRLARIVAGECEIKPYEVLVDRNAQAMSKRLRRQTLFMGLSDGARIDTIRHANSGLLSNEQFSLVTQVDTDKWKDLLKNLRDDLDDPSAKFRVVCLVDDFAGTGTSFLRFDKESREWKGKFIRFKESVEGVNAELHGDKVFQDDWVLCVHHHIASASAAAAIAKRLRRLPGTGIFQQDWAQATYPTFGTVLPEDLPIDAAGADQDEFRRLTQIYYDPILQTRHTDVGEVPHLGLGYGGCALPLVLEHNTPNNAVALLWAKTDGGIRKGVLAPAMRPLFRRRQRHG